MITLNHSTSSSVCSHCTHSESEYSSAGHDARARARGSAVTEPHFPDAPSSSYVTEEGWLVVGEQAWTLDEWTTDHGVQYRRHSERRRSERGRSRNREHQRRWRERQR